MKRELYREAVRATALGLAVNLGLGVAKLAGGIVGGSLALVSDAVNSLGDVFTSSAILLAFRVAQKPADAEHPYGHTRAEAIAGSNVAVLVIASALMVGWGTIRSFPLEASHQSPPLWALAIAGVNVVIKEALYQYKIRLGRRLGSSALTANAWDHRSDAFSALAVLIGLSLVRIGGPKLLFMDGVSALVVVAVILVSAARLLVASGQELMDAQADQPFVDEIRAFAAGSPGVRQVDKLWVRKTGLEYLVDIHVQVPADLTVAEGHTISHLVKDRLLERYPILRDVLVHLEPYSAAHASPKAD
ncbi:MAG: cation diffusion facilitator family transporter [Paludisphaera borealis]|uniref:cation diffusion facilitator family transporter n=1 Tax=Paludisphaera borealis TaxID=1387353 RepID=UPI002848E761|nr:cation diffusion facilitator family transporter [Paludisphaera borealis]MDR3620078.1 cation diffusion facilitator family transporter [Paludisphaera borealis]